MLVAGVGLEDFIIDYRGFTVCWLQGWGWSWRTSLIIGDLPYAGCRDGGGAGGIHH